MLPPIAFSKIHHQELRIERALSRARLQFHLDQELEDSVLRGQEIMRNRDRGRGRPGRDILGEKAGELVRNRPRDREPQDQARNT